jgi:hypothetical protein
MPIRLDDLTPLQGAYLKVIGANLLACGAETTSPFFDRLFELLEQSGERPSDVLVMRCAEQAMEIYRPGPQEAAPVAH